MCAEGENGRRQKGRASPKRCKIDFVLAFVEMKTISLGNFCPQRKQEEMARKKKFSLSKEIVKIALKMVQKASSEVITIKWN